MLATEVATKQRLNLVKLALERLGQRKQLVERRFGYRNGASPDIVAPESCIRCLSWRWFEKDEWTEDAV